MKILTRKEQDEILRDVTVVTLLCLGHCDNIQLHTLVDCVANILDKTCGAEGIVAMKESLEEQVKIHLLARMAEKSGEE